MKLRGFTSLVATMVMASTAGAAEVYNKGGNTLNIFGSFVGGGTFVENGDQKNRDCSVLRCGVFGKTFVNDQIFGFGMWEHEISFRNVEGSGIGNNNQPLVGYTGIEFGNFGSIDYGRNYGVLYDVGSWVDIIPAFGGDVYFPDNFLSSRGSNIITYRNKNFFGLLDGFNFAIQYQGKNDVNEKTGRTVKTANGEGYGVSASYELSNGLAASAAYVNSRRTIDQKNLNVTSVVYDGNKSKVDVAEAYSLGVKYSKNGAYFAASYGETYNMTPFGQFGNSGINPECIYGFVNRASNVGLVMQYQFDFGLSPSVSYVHLKANDLENGYSSYLKKCVTVGASYILDKNVATTVDYRLNFLSKDDFSKATGISTDDVVAFGVTYTF